MEFIDRLKNLEDKSFEQIMKRHPDSENLAETTLGVNEFINVSIGLIEDKFEVPSKNLTTGNLHLFGLIQLKNMFETLKKLREYRKILLHNRNLDLIIRGKFLSLDLPDYVGYDFQGTRLHLRMDKWQSDACAHIVDEKFLSFSALSRLCILIGISCADVETSEETRQIVEKTIELLKRFQSTVKYLSRY